MNVSGRRLYTIEVFKVAVYSGVEEQRNIMLSSA
jgi:hypothetical protein